MSQPSAGASVAFCRRVSRDLTPPVTRFEFIAIVARGDGFCSGLQVWQALAGLFVFLRYRGGWRTGAKVNDLRPQGLFCTMQSKMRLCVVELESF